jgi:hypothetical protein
MSSTWRQLLDMKTSGTLRVPGGFVPMSPSGCVSIHQCTKILLVAKRYQLYSHLNDPLSGHDISLNDEMVDELCQSNVAFLADLASIAPIAAAVQRDVKVMIELENQSGSIAGADRAPVTSEVQQEKVLSRYNILAMGIAASETSASIESQSNHSVTGSFDHVAAIPDSDHLHAGPASSAEVAPHSPGLSFPGQGETCRNYVSSSMHPQQQQHDSNESVASNPDGPGGLNAADWEHQSQLSAEPFPGNLILDYSVAPSEFDMSGELDWFMTHIP